MKIVFDLEADGFRDEATRTWCLVLGNPERPQRMREYGPDQIDEGLAELAKADEIIGHNILNYDLPLLERLHGWTFTGQVTDTVVMSRLFRSDRQLPELCPGNTAPHSLAAWGYRLGRGKPEHEDWTQYSEAMLHRCSEDVAINIMVYRALCKEQRESGIDWTDALRTEHDSARNITTQELNGVPLDLPLVWRTRLELKDRMASIRKEVVPLCPPVPLPKSKQPTWPTKQYKKNGAPTVNALKYYGDSFGASKEYRTDLVVRTAPINLNSDKQVKEYLLSIGWIPTEWNFKKDKRGKPLRDPQGNKIRTSPRLTLDSLESCTWPEAHAQMGGDIVKHLMMSHREGMLRGWMRDVRPDGRISAQALPLGTPTGRMTHRKVVNVPGNDKPYGTELRSCFSTVPGYTRVGIDLASCQLRALCHYMEDEEYQREVVEGDPHVYAAELAGLSSRQDGKKMNYTVLFGGGVDMVSTSLGVSKVQAKVSIDTFFGNLPALDTLQKKLKRQWKEKGYLVGIDGRIIWVRAEHMLLNYMLQTMEAVIMKNFINFQTMVCSPLEPQLVTTMHDEVQFLVPDENVQSFKTMARWSIDRVNEKFSLTCPQDIDINVGSTWSECH